MRKSLELLANLNDHDLSNINSSKLCAFLLQFKRDVKKNIVVHAGFDSQAIALKWQSQIFIVSNEIVLSGELLQKINSICKLLKDRGPDAACLVQMYSAIYLYLNATKEERKAWQIRSALDEYQEYLSKQIENQPQWPNATPSSEQKKLYERFACISRAYQSIQNKDVLSDGDLVFIKEQVQSCIKNQPTWQECPLLQKLLDILSLGLRPLYRFFSREEKVLNNILLKARTPQ